MSTLTFTLSGTYCYAFSIGVICGSLLPRLGSSLSNLGRTVRGADTFVHHPDIGSVEKMMAGLKNRLRKDVDSLYRVEERNPPATMPRS